MLWRALHELCCATERVLEPWRDVVSRKSTLHSEHHMCPDRRKELLCTSQFVRVIRDSEDQSEQAQDRNTPPSPQASWHKRKVIPAFNPGGATRRHRDDATPGKRLLPLRLRVCPLLTTIFRLQAHLGTAAYVQHARFTSRTCTFRSSVGGLKCDAIRHFRNQQARCCILQRGVVPVLPANMFDCS